MRRQMKRMVSFLLAVVMALGLLPASALAFTEEEGGLFRQMLELGLVDENGALRTDVPIVVDGGELTLDEMRLLLENPGTDREKVATVDGVELTLGDLETMLGIEDRLAEIAQAFSSTMTRNMLGGPPAQGSGIDHDARVKMVISKSEDGNGLAVCDVTFNLVSKDAPDTPITLDYDVSFTFEALAGTAGINTYLYKDGVQSAYYALPTTVTIGAGSSIPTAVRGNSMDANSYIRIKGLRSKDLENPAADWDETFFLLRAYAPQNVLFYQDAGQPSRTSLDQVCSNGKKITFDPKDISFDTATMYGGGVPYNFTNTGREKALTNISDEIAKPVEAAFPKLVKLVVGCAPQQLKLSVSDLSGGDDFNKEEMYLSYNGTKGEPSLIGKTIDPPLAVVVKYDGTSEPPTPNVETPIGLYPVGDNDSYKNSYNLHFKLEIYDKTPPEIKSVEVKNTGATFHTGQQVPIAVTFNEAVTGKLQLVLNDGETLENYEAAGHLSPQKLFLYTVKEMDNTSITVKSITSAGGSNPAKDLMGNKLVTREIGKTVTEKLVSALPENGILSVATDKQNYTPGTEEGTITVSVNQDPGYGNVWANLGETITARVDNGDPVVLSAKTVEGTIVLTGAFAIPENQTTDASNHIVELYIDGKLLIGKRAAFTVAPFIKVDAADVILQVNGEAIAEGANWPSGAVNVVYPLEETATQLSYTYTGNATYQGSGDFSWSSSNPEVLQIDGEGVLWPKTTGTAEISLTATNGSREAADHTVIQVGTLEVKADDRPGITIPANANSFTVSLEQDLTVTWMSNLAQAEPLNGTVTLELFEGKVEDFGTAGLTAVYTNDQIPRSATSATIPGQYLMQIATGDTPSYTIRLSAQAVRTEGRDAETVHTVAYVFVRSLPAVVRITGVEEGDVYRTDGDPLDIGWTVSSYDGANGCEFQFIVSKNGETVETITAVGEKTGAQSYAGAYTLTPEPVAADSLKDIYLVTVRAKNTLDATWSYDSRTVTVYKSGALKIETGGADKDSLVLANPVTAGGSPTAFTISNMTGGTYTAGGGGDLGTAESIAGLRSELGLVESISINFGDYKWNTLDDVVKWVSDNPDAVTVNYRQGTLYEDIRKFSFTAYTPETVLALCGLSDGVGTVTATHALVEELTDSVSVRVERLQNKLYLFQMLPGTETTLSYRNGNGESRTVTTNSDGSMALYEPSGIQGDIQAISAREGDTYMGTFAASGLRSGEGSGVRQDLYPLNTLTLRQVAKVEIPIQAPNGSAYANKPITLRGGVYRNGEYCADARLYSSAGDYDNGLDGTQDQHFTTNAAGALEIYWNITQFTTPKEEEPVALGDDLQFVLELQFPDAAQGSTYSFYPALAYVDGSLNEKDRMRSGADLLILEQIDPGKGKEPFVAAQTVDYGTGREISVRRHTGVVGPNGNYPDVTLRTTAMLWGYDAGAVDFQVDMVDEFGIKPAAQSSEVTTYPFSSIALVRNTMELKDGSLWFPEGSENRQLRMRLYNTAGQEAVMLRDVPMPFKVVNLLKAGRVEESTSLLNLLASIASGEIAGVLGKNSTEITDKVNNSVVGDGLDFLTKFGAKAGLARAVLTPTEDAARFTGYIWTGLDNTSFNDAEYDENGVLVEGHFWEGELDVGGLGVSDFKAMANGSFFEETNAMLADAAVSYLGFPGEIQLSGYTEVEILFNYDTMEWEVYTLGGGFSAGVQASKDWNKTFFVGYIPMTASFEVGGGIQVKFEAAMRYAQQNGLTWSDPDVQRVNDYLTSLRIQAYIEAFAGFGVDYSLVALKVGLFGGVEVENENRFLSRTYLADKNQRQINGQYLKLDGEVGVKAVAKLLFVSYEAVIASGNFGRAWEFNEWDEINEYWKSATSGLAYSAGLPAVNALSLGGGAEGLRVVSDTATVQSRAYLENGDRAWLGGAERPMLFSILPQDESVVKELETNSYPYSDPLISDDGKLLVYLSDADSSAVEATEIRYSQRADGSGIFPNGSSLDTDSNFNGYGDSNVSFDGTGDFAAAAWVRQNNPLQAQAGQTIDLAGQALMLNSAEVMASVWDGRGWETTRITDNSGPDLAPVVAAAGDKAILAWRSAQSADPTGNDGAGLTEFGGQDRILYKVYDKNNGGWSEETYTLYNGTSGSVKGLAAEMLTNGTAAVAYTLDTQGKGDISDYEIYYAVLNSAQAADASLTVRATTDSYLDENPSLTTAGDHFVLGWHSLQSASGAESHDLRLLAFGANGAPVTSFPDALSDVVGTTTFNGQFAFVKGASDLEDLSVLWNDAGSGGSNNDVLRAVKFALHDNRYIASAPIEVAKMPKKTSADHFDAYLSQSGATQITAVLLGNTVTGEETIQNVTVPQYTANLYTAVEEYKNAIQVADIGVDYGSLRRNAPLPLTFTVTNRGMEPITALSVSLGGGDPQKAENLALLPGQSKTLSLVHHTGVAIENVPYAITATFGSAGEVTAEGTAYLEYPDVGISRLDLVKEQDGLRTMQATMYNQSEIPLEKAGARRVVLGVYSDPSCNTPIDGKYFEGGTPGSEYQIILSDASALQAIDSGAYTLPFTFHIGDYIKDAAAASGEPLDEIPGSGVTLFVRAHVEQNTGTGTANWIALPEADGSNNQTNITFTSLLERSGGDPTTVTVNQGMDADGNTTASVTLRNNSLQQKTTGNVIVSLLDENGAVLESKQSYQPGGTGLVQLKAEGTAGLDFTFSRSGAAVRASYGDAVVDDNTNAAVSSISLEGTPLTLESFDADDTAAITGMAAGRYTLRVVSQDPGAAITVNGAPAENGTADITLAAGQKTDVAIQITARNGQNTQAYTLSLQADGGGSSESDGFGWFGTEVPSAPKLTHNAGGTVKAASDNKTITITPDEGYEVASVTINGKLLDLNGDALERLENGGLRYVFGRASSGNAVEVVFQKIGETHWENPFADVAPEHWFYDAVKYVHQKGLFAGTSDTTFDPNLPMTRAMLVTVLHRMAGAPKTNSGIRFTDVREGMWYTDGVLWAAENGIVVGYSDGRFGPDAPITREQLAVILWRYAGSPAAPGTLDAFVDAEQAGDYARQALRWAVEKGLVTGKGNGILDPRGQATRAEVAAMLMRFGSNG